MFYYLFKVLSSSVDNPLKAVISEVRSTTGQKQANIILTLQSFWMKLPFIFVMWHWQGPLGLLSVSSVRQDYRACFVDTERTWFLECSQLNVWIWGLRHRAGGWSWAGGTILCLWTSLNPLNSSSWAGNWNIVQYWHADGHLSQGPAKRRG